MKRARKNKTFNFAWEEKTIPVGAVDCSKIAEDYDEKELKTRVTYFLLNGAPTFAVNAGADGRYKLLAAERDFCAVVFSGEKQIQARVYHFDETNAEIFTLTERLKTEGLGAMDEAYLMERLIKEYRLTQDEVANLIGKSRPAVANTLRLLTLEPEVIGLIESGKFSAGHARTLVKVPKDKQLAFAMEAINRDYSVREMERAVKAYMTPPEVLKREKDAALAAKGAELKALVERMRTVFRTKVSLVGNAKKGRIYIDYYSAEDLYRFEEYLDMIESFNRD
jgi:ParB family chromosome partitioning protein